MSIIYKNEEFHETLCENAIYQVSNRFKAYYNAIHYLLITDKSGDLALELYWFDCERWMSGVERKINTEYILELIKKQTSKNE